MSVSGLLLVVVFRFGVVVSVRLMLCGGFCVLGILGLLMLVVDIMVFVVELSSGVVVYLVRRVYVSSGSV